MTTHQLDQHMLCFGAGLSWFFQQGGPWTGLRTLLEGPSGTLTSYNEHQLIC